MSGNGRRAKIEQMLQDEPQDIFLRYSLAMEMQTDGDVEDALAMFRTLSEESPPHVPAFFRSAQLLAEQSEVESARDFLRRGIEAARTQGDAHAAAEMSEMLSELGALGE